MKKKKKKIWEKINLLETSIVGIPSYPDAHLDANFSFIKALKKFEADEESKPKLNLAIEKQEALEEEKAEAEIEEAPEEAQDEEAQTDSPPETENSEPSEESEKEEPSEGEEKLDYAKISEIVSKALKDAIQTPTERGLVVTKKELEEMSLGEMALKVWKQDLARQGHL